MNPAHPDAMPPGRLERAVVDMSNTIQEMANTLRNTCNAVRTIDKRLKFLKSRGIEYIQFHDGGRLTYPTDDEE